MKFLQKPIFLSIFLIIHVFIFSNSALAQPEWERINIPSGSTPRLINAYGDDVYIFHDVTMQYSKGNIDTNDWNVLDVSTPSVTMNTLLMTPEHIYAFSHSGIKMTLWRYSYDSKKWIDISPFDDLNIAGIKEHQGKLYVIDHTQLYKSNDFGETWEVLFETPNCNFLYLHIYESDMYVGCSQEFYFSDNSGLDWVQKPTSLFPQYLVVHEGAQFCSSNFGSWSVLSYDNFETFEYINNGLDQTYHIENANDTIYAKGTINGELKIQISVDFGKTWSNLSDLYPPLNSFLSSPGVYLTHQMFVRNGIMILVRSDGLYTFDLKNDFEVDYKKNWGNSYGYRINLSQNKIWCRTATGIYKSEKSNPEVWKCHDNSDPDIFGHCETGILYFTKNSILKPVYGITTYMGSRDEGDTWFPLDFLDQGGTKNSEFVGSTDTYYWFFKDGVGLFRMKEDLEKKENAKNYSPISSNKINSVYVYPNTNIVQLLGDGKYYASLDEGQTWIEAPSSINCPSNPDQTFNALRLLAKKGEEYLWGCYAFGSQNLFLELEDGTIFDYEPQNWLSGAAISDIYHQPFFNFDNNIWLFSASDSTIYSSIDPTTQFKPFYKFPEPLSYWELILDDNAAYFNSGFGGLIRVSPFFGAPESPAISKKCPTIVAAPNPSRNQISLYSNQGGQSNNAEIRVYNSNGQLVFEESRNQEFYYDLEIGVLQTGQYTVHVISGDVCEIGRFQKL